jgi:hypothetical protein
MAPTPIAAQAANRRIPNPGNHQRDFQAGRRPLVVPGQLASANGLRLGAI